MKTLFASLTFLFGSILVVITACSTSKTGATKSAKKLYESFFVGEEGTQYFIKPISFVTKNKEEVRIDVTFRYKNEIKDSATLHFSFIHPSNFKSVDRFLMSNNQQSVELTNLKFMFSERNNNAYTCRFTGKISLSDLNQIFNHNDWKLALYLNDRAFDYQPQKSTKKKIELLHYEIFGLF